MALGILNEMITITKLIESRLIPIKSSKLFVLQCSPKTNFRNDYTYKVTFYTLISLHRMQLFENF